MADKQPALNQEETPLTLDVLLSHSCSNPVDWEAYELYQAQLHEWLNNDSPDKGPMPVNYGWNRYDITLHCTAWEIIACLNEDGTYTVREYHIQDH